MSYKSLRACVEDLERNGHLVRVAEEMDPCLEMAEIQRRLYTAEGPRRFIRAGQGLALPVRRQPLRHPRALQVHVPKHARESPEGPPAEG